MAKVALTDTCWLWEGSVQANGYGRFRLDGRTTYAHRASYALAHGEVPAGMQVDHTCHTDECTVPPNECPHRRCVNPAHLEAVTQAENLARGNTLSAKAAARSHCPNGHEYTPENTATWGGHRHCRTCRASVKRAAKQRKRAAHDRGEAA